MGMSEYDHRIWVMKPDGKFSCERSDLESILSSSDSSDKSNAAEVKRLDRCIIFEGIAANARIMG